MNVGERTIDTSSPPYVIAELGVNHDGYLDKAVQLVDAAKAAGADAIKLQCFNADLLLSNAATLADYQSEAGEQDARKMLQRLQLDEIAMAVVVEYAHEVRMHAIVTVFSVELVVEAERMAWDAYKIASPDVVNRPLIDRIRATGKPMFISTGAATLEEVACAVKWMGEHPFLLMQCVSSYPTPIEQASLGGRIAMAQQFPQAIGYSDHTNAIDTGGLAVASGVRLLEKHLTYDTNAKGPDHAASLNPADFAEYVRLAHRAFSMIGPMEKDVLDIEREVRALSRQSVTTTRDLPAGHVIEPEDLTVKRPGTGLPAAAIGICVGRKLKHAVRANAQLTGADFS